MIMHGIADKAGKIIARYGLHNSKMVAMGAFWNRQAHAKMMHFTEKRCTELLDAKGMQAKEFEVAA